MLSRWVTSSYSPPDDVMGSNCNDVASGPGAQERRKKEEKKRKGGRGEERRGVGSILFLCLPLYMQTWFLKKLSGTHAYKSM